LFIARVTKTVVCTIKCEKYFGRKLLVVEPLEINGLRSAPESVVAIDFVQAGKGDIVLVQEDGSSARLLMQDDMAPARSAIIGIVDSVDTEDVKGTEIG